MEFCPNSSYSPLKVPICLGARIRAWYSGPRNLQKGKGPVPSLFPGPIYPRARLQAGYACTKSISSALQKFPEVAAADDERRELRWPFLMYDIPTVVGDDSAVRQHIGIFSFILPSGHSKVQNIPPGCITSAQQVAKVNLFTRLAEVTWTILLI